jgi:hypothetical protein
MVTIGSIFQTQTSVTTTKEIKKYLLHPKEWIVGMILLAICGLARVIIVPAQRSNTSSSADYHGPLLDSVNSIDQAWKKMKTEYCKADIEILCGAKKPPQTGGCFAVYQPALSRLWRMQTSSSEVFYDCTLARQMQRLDDLQQPQQQQQQQQQMRTNNKGKPSLEYWDTILSNEKWRSVAPPELTVESVLPEDAKVVLKSMIYSILFMWEDAITYLPEEAFSLHDRSSSHRRDERERMVSFQVKNIIRVYQVFLFQGQVKLRMERNPLLGRTLIHYMQYAQKLLMLRGGDLSSVRGGARTNHTSSSLRMRANHDDDDDDPFYSEHLPMVERALDNLIQTGGITKPSNHYAKYSYSLFGDYRMDRCIYNHVNMEGSLITNLCELAVDTLPHRLQQIDMESGGDFALVTHMFMFGANMACLFGLLRLFSARRRLIERMDKGKRRLEQELNDPVLRQALERKAQTLPNREEFIAKLEQKAADWDSKAAALKMLRRTVMVFRRLLVFTMVVTTAVFVPLYMNLNVSLARYLETTMLSLSMFVVTYTVPMEDTKRNARDLLSAIEIATLDPSTTDALLADNNSNKSVADGSNYETNK